MLLPAQLCLGPLLHSHVLPSSYAGDFLPPSEYDVGYKQFKLTSTMNNALGRAVWIQPSLINHSCAPNVDVAIIGNFIFLRTTRDVAAGEELCIAYCDCGAVPFAARAARLAAWNKVRHLHQVPVSFGVR